MTTTLKLETLSDGKAFFGKAMHLKYRGTSYLIVAPSVGDIETLWYDLHPGAAMINRAQVKDVGVMSEDVIRSAHTSSNAEAKADK